MGCKWAFGIIWLGFLPSDKYGKINKTEKSQILTLASKNG